MAHRGKHYPLYLRRDLQMQLQDNNWGVPLRYDLTLATFQGTVGIVLSNTTHRLSTPLDVGPGVIEWYSSPISIGARTIQIVLIVGVDGNPQRNAVSFEVRDLAAGVLGRSGPFIQTAHPLNFATRQHNISPLVVDTPGVFTQTNFGLDDSYIAVGY